MSPADRGVKAETVKKSEGPSGDRLPLAWSRHTAQDLLVVSAAWALLLAIMALAQAMGYSLGFAVWPLGEDRVWIESIQQQTPLAAAKAFWQINDRNALAPWWYIALAPVILGYDGGLFLIRVAVGLLLALSAYIFLLVFTRSRAFALGVACVVAVFLGNGYLDQIYWTMQLALVFSLWSLTFYKIFIDGSRSDYRLYAAAIVAWFFALGTYSIQTGAILAVALIAFTAPATGMLVRVRRAITDTLPFALIFVAFWLEWQTAAREAYTTGSHVIGGINVTRPHLFAGLASLRQAFWHFDRLTFFNEVVYVAWGYRLIFAAAAAAVGLFVFCAVGSRDRAGASPPRLWHLFVLACAVSCLMVPTVLVEASGYGIPGQGWRKAYQLTTPLLYLGVAAAVLGLLPARAARPSWRVAAAVAAALATAVTLGLNRNQVEVTKNEKLLRSALVGMARENLADKRSPPFHFLVRRDPDFLWYSSDVLSPVYGRTWKLPAATSFRFLPDAATTEPQLSLRFTEGGVENAALDGTTVADEHVYLISASARGIRRLCRLGPEDVRSPVAQWQRATALTSSIGDCRGG
jgi:hypothetical protein